MSGVLMGVGVVWIVAMVVASCRALRRGWALSAPDALDSVLTGIDLRTNAPRPSAQETREAVEAILTADRLAGRISTATYRRALEHLAAGERVSVQRA